MELGLADQLWHYHCRYAYYGVFICLLCIRTVRGGRISHSRLSLATLLCCFLFFLAARQAQCSRSRTTYVLSHVSRRLCPNEATFMLRQRASCILICAPVYQPYHSTTKNCAAILGEIVSQETRTSFETQLSSWIFPGLIMSLVPIRSGPKKS